MTKQTNEAPHNEHEWTRHYALEGRALSAAYQKGNHVTDNVAVLVGFTKAVVAESDQHVLFLLIKPDADLDDSFKAWDTDEQEFIRVNGWLFTVQDWPSV